MIEAENVQPLIQMCITYPGALSIVALIKLAGPNSLGRCRCFVRVVEFESVVIICQSRSEHRAVSSRKSLALVVLR